MRGSPILLHNEVLWFIFLQSREEPCLYHFQITCSCQCLQGKRKAHKPFVWALRKKTLIFGEALSRCTISWGFSVPHIRTLCLCIFPLIWNVDPLNTTRSRKPSCHCILHLNAKVTSFDVVCRFQKLQQVKTVGLHVLSLSQHPPHISNSRLTRSTLSSDTRGRPALFPL